MSKPKPAFSLSSLFQISFLPHSDINHIRQSYIVKLFGGKIVKDISECPFCRGKAGTSAS